MFEILFSAFTLIIAGFSLWYTYVTKKNMENAVNYTAALRDTINNMDFGSLGMERMDAPRPDKKNKLFAFIPRGEKFNSFGR